MTATNPHPLANPFNRQRYAAYETSQPKKFFTRCNDPSKLEVPESSMSFSQIADTQNSLTVPYSAPDDIGCSSTAAFGFIGSTSLFRLHDGSVIDLKTHKIVHDPNAKFKAAGCWNDPNAVVLQDTGSEWGKTETITSLLNAKESAGECYDPNLDPKSIAYWQRAREESAKLKQNMTDEQKQLLDALSNEQFFPLSRLEEEHR